MNLWPTTLAISLLRELTQFETMRESELRYIKIAEGLQDQLITTENQLKKEVQLRKEAQNIFEAHDDKLQLQLNEYLIKIRDQEKLIITLKAEIRRYDVAAENYDKMEQTSPNAPQNIDKEIRNDDKTSRTNSFLLNGLIQLRLRQEKIESTVNLLEEQLKQTSNIKDPATPYANRAPPWLLQTHSVKTLQTFRQDKQTRISCKNRTYVFSVSLQVTEFKDSSKHQKQRASNQARGNIKPVEAKIVSSPKKSTSGIDSQLNGRLIPDMLNTHSTKIHQL